MYYIYNLEDFEVLSIGIIAVKYFLSLLLVNNTWIVIIEITYFPK
jgi:hypothetical protein